MGTLFTDRAAILADLWINYRDDEEFQDFFKYADLGLPLAYAVSNGIVEPTESLEGFVNEAFELFLSGLEVEDAGFETLDELLEL